MSRRQAGWRQVLGLLALAFVLLATSCGPRVPTRTVRGVLVDVQSSGLRTVEEFTLRTDDGQELVFHPTADFGQNPAVGQSMTPGHMREHMALAEPVTVTYRDENGTLVALGAAD